LGLLLCSLRCKCSLLDSRLLSHFPRLQPNTCTSLIKFMFSHLMTWTEGNGTCPFVIFNFENVTSSFKTIFFGNCVYLCLTLSGRLSSTQNFGKNYRMPENFKKKEHITETTNWFELACYRIEWSGYFDTCVRHEFLFR
jgi:hypothetical protein